MGGYRDESRSLSFSWNWILIGTLLLINFGMVFLGADFAKSGIALNLPTSFGSLQHFQPKLFPFEIFLLFLLFVNILNYHGTVSRIRTIWGDPLGRAILVVFGVGLFRVLFDLGRNPILVARNSAFVWYLSVPILLSLSGITSDSLEKVAKVLTAAVFLIFLYSVWLAISEKSQRVNWYPYAGMYFALFLGLTVERRKIAIPLIASVGFPLGFSVWDKFQRTSLVGMICTVGLVFFFVRTDSLRALKRLAIFFAFFVFGGLFWYSLENTTSKVESSFDGIGVSLPSGQKLATLSPFRKAQSDDLGIEIFRGSMWKDAFEKFCSNPIFGLGFEKPVVSRVFVGGNKYIENTGGFEKYGTPPIAGPHNSYLNALVRLGIFGILFLPLHIFAAIRLWKHRLFATFFLFLGQVVYAFFNVGLEGPTRSSILLMGMATAVLVMIEAKGHSSDTPLQGHIA